jgi:hypothetical protein
MHVGPNDKGLFWKEDVLQQIAPMFKDITFKYDVGGSEGTSHVPQKLYSPYFDVGWVDKAWYDPRTKALWVEGDVTDPTVIQKLLRKTSTGKRELNYASMGVLIDPEQIFCRICNKVMASKERGSCGHERLKQYGTQIAYAVPGGVVKTLHAALTNSPADTEAAIADVIFQELNTRGGRMVDQVGPNPTASNSGPKRGNEFTSVQVKPQTNMPIGTYQRDEAHQTSNSEVGAVPARSLVTNTSVQAMAEGEAPATSPVPDEAGMAPGGDADVQLVDVIKAMATELSQIRQELAALKAGQGSEGAPTMGAQSGDGEPGGSPMGSPEVADIAKKYYKGLVRECADKFVKSGKAKTGREAVLMLQDMSINQLETISMTLDGLEVPRVSVNRPVPQTVPEYGAPNNVGSGVKTFADMTPNERRANFNSNDRWANCWTNPNAVPQQQ